MLRKTGISTLLCSVLVFTACGGGGNGGNQEDPVIKEIKKRDGIVIFHEYSASVCQSDTLKSALQKEGLRDIITSVEDNSINCAHYGRANDGNTCTEELFGGYPNACVIAANISIDTAKTANIMVASDNAIADIQ